MTDETPCKKLTLKKKRIIRRDDLPAAKLGKPGNKPQQPKPNKKRKPKQAAKKPTVKPSYLRAEELDTRLMQFDIWKHFKPLAIDIEKDIFRLCNDEQIAGASKKVVQKVLHRHTSCAIYLTNLAKGTKRYHLNGAPFGEITQQQQIIAIKRLQ